MTVKRFEDLMVWQKSQDLACAIYQTFQTCSDYGFKDQICRAVVSISNNIAEGFDRSSNKDFKRFLNFALSSNSEVRSMLYLSERLNYTNSDATQKLIDASIEISKMGYAFKKSMN